MAVSCHVSLLASFRELCQASIRAYGRLGLNTAVYRARRALNASNAGLESRYERIPGSEPAVGTWKKTIELLHSCLGRCLLVNGLDKGDSASIRHGNICVAWRFGTLFSDFEPSTAQATGTGHDLS